MDVFIVTVSLCFIFFRGRSSVPELQEKALHNDLMRTLNTKNLSQMKALWSSTNPSVLLGVNSVCEEHIEAHRHNLFLSFDGHKVVFEFQNTPYQHSGMLIS